MKIKPFLILAASAIILAACCILFIRSKSLPSPENDEVVQYLVSFKKHFSNGGGIQPLLDFFKDGRETMDVYEPLAALTGAPPEDNMFEESFKVDFDADKATVKFINSELSVVTVPITFSKEGLDKKYSLVYLTVQKTGHHQYKILKLDGRNFMIAHQNYSNYIEENRYPDKDVYTPATLNAFKGAARLRTKYDSVVWFSHLNGKNWFYVINGKWEIYKAFGSQKDSAKTYEMGLVDPQFKEIIPPKFDVVRNIGGTIANLIEVEKDHKRGLYDLAGKIIVPVVYDQIMPVKDAQNLAVLKKGNDFYWFRDDYTISAKVDIKIADVLARLKQHIPFKLINNPGRDVMEFNSRRMHEAVYLPPSYLVDLGLIEDMQLFKNPMRHKIYSSGSTESYEVTREPEHAVATKSGSNWLASIFYNIKEYYVSGRVGFYTARNLVIIDKKSNTAYSAPVASAIVQDFDADSTAGCIKNSVKALNDSLFEVMVPSFVSVKLYDGDVLEQMPFYQYFAVKNGRLVEQNTRRQFAFTKFRKLNDSYINGCYRYEVKTSNNNSKNIQSSYLNQYALQYMKNEIYASYNYDFNDKKWAKIFSENITGYKAKNINVDDSLTVIDKYNINFINSKLNSKKPNSLAAK